MREESAHLPKTGVNIQLFFIGEGGIQPVITRMARELNEDFSICWAKIEDFRDSVYGSLVINVKDESKEKIEAFLDQHHTHWEVLK